MYVFRGRKVQNHPPMQLTPSVVSSSNFSVEINWLKLRHSAKFYRKLRNPRIFDMTNSLMQVNLDIHSVAKKRVNFGDLYLQGALIKCVCFAAKHHSTNFNASVFILLYLRDSAPAIQLRQCLHWHAQSSPLPGHLSTVYHIGSTSATATCSYYSSSNFCSDSETLVTSRRASYPFCLYKNLTKTELKSDV